MRLERTSRRILVLAGVPLFCALAIGNAAGYRYGVSDLAFYLPAAFHSIDPELFPRDAALLAVQSRLTVVDEALGYALRAAGIAGFGPHATVYALHLLTLVGFYAAALGLGRATLRSGWAVAAFVTALTLRHAVGRTGVNTLEGYFHPRIVAFAIGMGALALFLRRRTWTAIALASVAALVHPTTAFWFVVCLGMAGLVADSGNRVRLLAVAILAAATVAAAMTHGPLAGRLQPMDAAWLAVIAEKDYLFPDRWPLDAWLVCVLYVAAIAGAGWQRARMGLLAGRERGLLAGAGALLAIFVVMLPPLFVRSALAVQAQPSRVFWILDVLATLGVVSLVEGAGTPGRRRAVRGLAAALLVFSCARSVYLVTVRFPERSLATIEPPETAWRDAMRWAESTPKDTHWLAHPQHAVLYGSSLRVSARRDVFVEANKDTAIAMYDRAVALQVAERRKVVADFDTLSAPAARRLAAQYDLDYMITEVDLPLPLAYRNTQFRIYRLTP